MAELIAPDGRSVKAVVFDLDGTLLNTLPDLVALTNATLEQCGYPKRTADEILSFVGSGVQALIRLAVPQSASDDDVVRASNIWQSLYPDYGYKLTHPYDGIKETVEQLKQTGVKLAVLSNKFDAAAKEVVGVFLPSLFDAVHGESPDYPRKPNPAGLLRTLEELGVHANECVFVGDSSNDMRVAHASGAYSVGVTWGYSSIEVLHEEKAESIISYPQELITLLSR